MVDVKTVAVCVSVSVVVCVVVSVVALLSGLLRPGVIHVAHPTSSEGDFLSFTFLYINISINQSINICLFLTKMTYCIQFS